MKSNYESFFGKSNKKIYKIFSPYRICPIGAHVDHQQGIVTGFAINKGVNLEFTVTTNGEIFLKSLSYPTEIKFNVRPRTQLRQTDWGDYIRGASHALKKRFVLNKGIKGVIEGTLPIGGLSSSAAVLVAYVMALSCANDIILNPIELIQIASDAEREYVGLNNGILDQSCVVLCKKDELLFLDTASNQYRNIPKHTKIPDFEFGIFFSGLTRSLITSDYNLRVNECKAASWNMLAFKDMPLKNLEHTYLRDVPFEIYNETKEKLPPRFNRRAEHFYSEFNRVNEGVTAWETGNLKWFGQLSFKSCESSIKNYECGSPELISIYEIMKETKGIYGGRFSGAGFKGACICIINPDYKDEIRSEVKEKYIKLYPQYKDSFEIHFCRTEDGARFL